MVRLVAEDGYTAQRHYSIASAPDDSGHIELTLDHVRDGEVSGWFHTVARPGDRIEMRGPLSGFFAWPGDRPALLLGAGSGVVPLMSMVRHHRARGLTFPLRLLVSARGPEDLIYADEYGPETTPVFTRAAPEGAAVGRLAAAHVAPLLAEQPPGGWEAYVAAPTPSPSTPPGCWWRPVSPWSASASNASADRGTCPNYAFHPLPLPRAASFRASAAGAPGPDRSRGGRRCARGCCPGGGAARCAAARTSSRRGRRWRWPCCCA
ncbi:Flavohemoprotein [Streptomyces griseoloalbus]